MPKLYKYKKITDQFTTHAVQAEGIVELCEIDGDTIISVPDDAKLEASKVLAVEAVELTDELAVAIREKSDVVQMVNTMVVEKIREKYDVNKELELMRRFTLNDLTVEEEMKNYNTYVEACVLWGREEKAKFGV